MALNTETYCKDCKSFDPIDTKPPKIPNPGGKPGKCLFLVGKVPFWALHINTVFEMNGINCETFEPKN